VPKKCWHAQRCEDSAGLIEIKQDQRSLRLSADAGEPTQQPADGNLDESLASAEEALMYLVGIQLVLARLAPA
jgi:hypothetical protein